MSSLKVSGTHKGGECGRHTLCDAILRLDFAVSSDRRLAGVGCFRVTHVPCKFTKVHQSENSIDLCGKRMIGLKIRDVTCILTHHHKYNHHS